MAETLDENLQGALTTTCYMCGKVVKEGEVERGPFGYRCKECNREATSEERQRKLRRYIKDLIAAQVDTALESREAVPSLSDVLIAAYDEFGGPTQLGTQWARVIQAMIDECLVTGNKADKAHRAILEFTKLAHAYEEAEDAKNYDEMTPEELEENRKTALLQMFADMLKHDTSDKLLEAARVLADADD